MTNMTAEFLTIGSPNNMVKEISTEELIGYTIPSAVALIGVTPKGRTDVIARAKECLNVVAKELESRGVVSSEQLLDVMGLD